MNSGRRKGTNGTFSHVWLRIELQFLSSETNFDIQSSCTSNVTYTFSDSFERNECIFAARVFATSIALIDFAVRVIQTEKYWFLFSLSNITFLQQRNFYKNGAFMLILLFSRYNLEMFAPYQFSWCKICSNKKFSFSLPFSTCYRTLYPTQVLTNYKCLCLHVCCCNLQLRSLTNDFSFWTERLMGILFCSVSFNLYVLRTQYLDFSAFKLCFWQSILLAFNLHTLVCSFYALTFSTDCVSLFAFVDG